MDENIMNNTGSTGDPSMTGNSGSRDTSPDAAHPGYFGPTSGGAGLPGPAPPSEETAADALQPDYIDPNATKKRAGWNPPTGVKA